MFLTDYYGHIETNYIMTNLFEIKMTREEIIEGLRSNYGIEFTAADVKGFCAMNDIGYSTVTKKIEDFKVGRGKWNLEVTQKAVDNIERSYSAPAVMPVVEENLVPEIDSSFVKFGNFADIKNVIKSKLFYPTFITGLSGNGKTFGVEQACAQLKREIVRVNITIETDEDDLIGGFRLVNGETVWHNGPVIEALERGAILLLDEIVLASNKILCLQSVLEGNGVFLKKIGRFVKPTEGFNVFATANTKGKGSDDGRFIGTNVLNEAFLERFPVTFEQSYPKPSVEQKILDKIAHNLGVKDTEFCKRLVDWGDIISKTFYDGGIEEIISTRRLVHIVRAYSIFNDKMKAIQVCVNRFDDETKQAFLELYDKVDADVDLDKLEDKMYD
jgi:midasin (ATPase involved in ribosome maturation)